MKPNKFFSVSVFVMIAFGLSVFITSCQALPGIHGSGNVLKETRKVASFDGIEVSGAFRIILKQGDIEEVIVESDANLLPVISTVVEGSILKIDTKKQVHDATSMKVYITVKNLKKIDVSGAVDVETSGRIAVPDLEFDASGASDSKMDIAVSVLTLDCSGASKMKLTGSAANVRMDLSGASEIFAYDLLSENYNIEISGAGNAQINVSKSLRAEISGAGSVKYKGSPTQIDQEVSGAGSIKKVD